MLFMLHITSPDLPSHDHASLASVWSVRLQVSQLLIVEGSSSLLADELDGIEGGHALFDQRDRHEHRCPVICY